MAKNEWWCFCYIYISKSVFSKYSSLDNVIGKKHHKVVCQKSELTKHDFKQEVITEKEDTLCLTSTKFFYQHTRCCVIMALWLEAFLKQYQDFLLTFYLFCSIKIDDKKVQINCLLIILQKFKSGTFHICKKHSLWMKSDTLLTVNLPGSKKQLGYVAEIQVFQMIEQFHRSVPAGWDNSSADWNLWLKSWPYLKMHALSLCSHFLWVAGVWSWYRPRKEKPIKLTISHNLIELSTSTCSCCLSLAPPLFFDKEEQTLAVMALGI